MGKKRNILNVGKKIETLMKKEFFSKKKRFYLFKSLLHKNGKAQIMPVVAGPFFMLQTSFTYRLK